MEETSRARFRLHACGKRDRGDAPDRSVGRRRAKLRRPPVPEGPRLPATAGRGHLGRRQGTRRRGWFGPATDRRRAANAFRTPGAGHWGELAGHVPEQPDPTRRERSHRPQQLRRDGQYPARHLLPDRDVDRELRLQRRSPATATAATRWCCGTRTRSASTTTSGTPPTPPWTGGSARTRTPPPFQAASAATKPASGTPRRTSPTTRSSARPRTSCMIGVNFYPTIQQQFRHLLGPAVDFQASGTGRRHDLPGGQHVRVGQVRPDLKNNDGSQAFTPVPAIQTDPSSTGYVLAMSDIECPPVCGTGTKLTVFTVTNSGGVPAVSAPNSITVGSYQSPPSAPQRGTSRTWTPGRPDHPRGLGLRPQRRGDRPSG